MGKTKANPLFPELLHVRLHEQREPAGREFLAKLLKGIRRHGSPLERRALYEAMPLLRRLRGGVYPPHERLPSHRGISRGRRYNRQAERAVPSN